MTLNPDGTIGYLPNLGYVGPDSFSYSVSDGHGGTSTATVSVTVNRVNQPPEASPDTASTTSIQPVLINVLANDSDPDGTLNAASVTIASQPGKGSVTLNPATGAITYTPDPAQFTSNGTDTFSYTVKANDGATSQPATVSIQVSYNNQPPTLQAQTISSKRGQTIAFQALNGTDPDGNEPLTYRIVGLPAGLGCSPAAASLSAGQVITCDLPVNAPLGNSSFQVVPVDSLGLSGQPATFSVQVAELDALQLKLFKDKPSVQVGDKYLIQASVTNPNPFPLKNVTATLSLNPEQLKLVRDSAKSGSISCQKYSLLNILGLNAYAQSDITFQYQGNNQLLVNIPSIAAGQTVDVNFQVTAQVANPSQINGVASLQDSPTLSNASIQVTATQPIFQFPSVLPRTGGAALAAIWSGGAAVILLSVALWMRKKKPKKTDIA